MIQCDGCGALLYNNKCEYCGTVYSEIDMHYKRELANQNVSTINFLLSILKSKKDNPVKWLKVSGPNPISLCEGVVPLPKNTKVEWIGSEDDYHKILKQKYHSPNIAIDDLKKEMDVFGKVRYTTQLLNDRR